MKYGCMILTYAAMLMLGFPGGMVETSTMATMPALDRSADLAGPDRDGDGIRDDIDSVIVGYGLPATQMSALRQFAAALQKIIVTTTDANSALANTHILERARSCVSQNLGLFANRYARQIKAYTLNTPPRATAYNAYMRKLGAVVLPVPDGSVCDRG